MVKTIKNTSSKKITFDTFSVNVDQEIEISWTKTKMTYDAYALILSTYLNGKIELLNGKGKSIKKVKNKPFFILEKKNGKMKKVKKTKEIDVALRKLNNQFTEMMDSYLD